MPHPAMAAYASRVTEYVAGRPGYPETLLADLPLADTIIELGAGTGKFTALLAQTGKRILAVEPLPEMAARVDSERLANVEVLIGSAEAIPVSDRSAGLICCATSFHWFDYVPATGEIVRTLEQGGTLALIWNVPDNSAGWMRAFADVLEGYAGNTPRRVDGRWRTIFDDARFEHVGTNFHPDVHPMTTDSIVDRAMSASFIAGLPHWEQQVVRHRITGIIDNEPSFAGKSSIEFPYVTEVHTFRTR